MISRPIAAAAAAGLALLAASASAEQHWQVNGGVASFDLCTEILRDLGLGFSLKGSVAPQPDMPNAVGFPITRQSTLSVLSKQGVYQSWQGGYVVAHGDFKLSGPGGRISVSDLSIVNENTGNGDNLFVRAGNSGSGTDIFDLSQIKIIYDHKGQHIVAGYADVALSARAARLIGRPDLAGQLLGMITFSASLKFTGGDPNEQLAPPPPGGPMDTGNGDVSISALLDLASYGRVGAYPNGTSGCGVGTTACNVSNITGDNANWYQQMDERHPVIAQNIYRITTVNGGTRFEQIGLGWVKHGFFATNSGGCGSCQYPGTGSLLGIHCSDTYGSGLNASQGSLGPRNEVNPFTGRWKCRGSYFSNYIDDCISRFTTGGLSAIDHRLQVRDQDLLTTGATFVYEAYYVSENDTDRYNNAAWRATTPTWSGSTWNFSSGGAQTQGPAINNWGDLRSTAQPTTQGDAILAVKVTNLGTGIYHYEYALYVHTLDRQIRQFSLPLPSGLTLQNVGFHDVDQIPDNDWTWTYTNNALTWSTQTYAQSQNANSIKWGTLYNFRFDANTAPTDSTVVLGLFKPGTLQSLTAATKAPANPFTFPTSMTTPRGIVLTGGLSDLLISDDSYLNMRPGVVIGSSEAPVQVVLEGTSTVSSPTQLKFRLESSANQANVGQTLQLFNFSTGQYDVVDYRTLPTTDGTFDVTASSATAYIETGTGRVRARISCKPNGPIVTYPWTVNFDQAVWIIN